MNYIKKIQGFVFLLYSTLFYQIGALLSGDPLIILSTLSLTLLVAFAFALNVTPIHDVAKACVKCTITQSVYTFYFLAILGLSFGPYFFMYIIDGVPVVQPDVEVARMILVDKYGFIYRIGTQACFFVPPVVVYGFANGHVRRLSAFVVLFSVLALLFSTGFRSRLLDYIVITAMSVALVSIFRKKTYSMIGIGRSLFILALSSVFAIALVVLLTSWRNDLTLYESIQRVTYRIFLLNYDTNFSRVFRYVESEGFKYGTTYFWDAFSIFIPGLNSSQVELTQYFNKINSDLFIMTTTAYGESYLNFGLLGFIFCPFVLVCYRFLFENTMCYIVRIKNCGILFFTCYVNAIFYIPRVASTGGMANAYYVKGASIFLIAFLVVSVVILLNRVVGVR